MIRLLTLVLLTGAISAQADPYQAPQEAPVGTAQASDAAPKDLLPEPPPLPPGKATLIGGTLVKFDRVRDELTVQPFGSSKAKIKILIDERTHIYRGETLISQRDLRAGQRIYLDTLPDRSSVLARNIRIGTLPTEGESTGQVVDYDHNSGELTLNETLSSKPVRLRLAPDASFLEQGKRTAAGALLPGSLVEVRFSPGLNNGEPTVHEVSLLAIPGSAVTFVGRVTFLDVSSGMLGLTDPRDKKSYEIYFSSSARVNGRLEVGADVTVSAVFESNRYVAKAIIVTSRGGN